ncbi:GSCOCG00009915001-RA-CDS, partial [Cotesia congregata]
MLKHVSISPWRGRSDSVSLASSNGDTSSCGSGSPTPSHTPPPSRASSCASLVPLTALSSFSPADTAPQQVSPL